MPAQNGDTILLGYGPQGEQQDGDTILLQYQAVEVTRRLIAGLMAPWSASRGLDPATRAPSASIATHDTERAAPWGKAAPLQDEGQRAPWGIAVATDDDRRAPWGKFDRELQPEQRAPWGVSAARDDQRAAPWGRYERRLQPELLAPWVVSRPRDHERAAPWGGPMVLIDSGTTALINASAPGDRDYLVPWAFYSRPLDPGWGIPTPPNPLPEPGEPIIVPVRRVYIVQNETLLIRVSDMATIPALRMSLRLDVDSWTWGFSATIPGDALSLVEPSGGQPRELEAIINGVQFRVLAEGLQRDRRFGRADVQITGRGKAALLAAPYSPQQVFANDEERTAQQLANDVLTLNGVPLGWDVNWDLTDWNVPAGIFNHAGSYMDGLVRIAQAAGGYIRPDPAAEALTFLHRYPTMPDTWAGLESVDYELPAAFTEREGIQWQDRAAYDAVYVSGQQAGVLALVKKLGSAGETFAQMVTDPLITANDAARQRGRAILGDTGRKAFVSLRVPVLEEFGVIEPGKFVKYTDGGVVRIGLVRSTQVDVERPSVWQQIAVETQIT